MSSCTSVCAKGRDLFLYDCRCVPPFFRWETRLSAVEGLQPFETRCRGQRLIQMNEREKRGRGNSYRVLSLHSPLLGGVGEQVQTCFWVSFSLPLFQSHAPPEWSEDFGLHRCPKLGGNRKFRTFLSSFPPGHLSLGCVFSFQQPKEESDGPSSLEGPTVGLHAVSVLRRKKFPCRSKGLDPRCRSSPESHPHPGSPSPT